MPTTTLVVNFLPIPWSALPHLSRFMVVAVDPGLIRLESDCCLFRLSIQCPQNQKCSGSGQLNGYELSSFHLVM